MTRVLMIDAYNMLHRARFGFGTGEHSITFNFFRSLRSEVERHKASMVYVVLEGRPVHRISESDGNYKGNREKITDTGFHRQKKEIFELCQKLPVTILRHPDYECDDAIATFTMIHHKRGDEVVICSSDSDFIQLLGPVGIDLWNPVKKSFISPWPVDYLTWKSLKGDPTDNVPGVKGVGSKTATKLTEDPDLLNEFLSKKPGREEAFISAKKQIKLIEINIDCPKWEKKDYPYSSKSLFEEFKNRQFKSIIGNAWKKWDNTWENVYEEHTTYRSADC